MILIMNINTMKSLHFSFYLTISVVTIKWVPVVGSLTGGIQASDIGVIIMTIFFVYIAIKENTLVLPKSILLFFTSFLIFTFSVRLHDVDFDGGLSSVKAVPYLVMALGIANIPHPENISLKKLTVASISTVSLAMVYSSNVAGLNIVEQLIKFITSLDPLILLYGLLRPMFNAFSPNNEILFSGSIMNELASGFALMFSIASASYLEKRSAIGFLMLIFPGAASIIVFSSSGALIFLYTCILISILTISGRKGFLKWLLVLVMIFLVSILYYIYLGSYVGDQLLSDSSNRSSRLNQYNEALNQINNHPIFGSKLETIDEHKIHNFFLSLIVSGGLLGAIFAVLSHFVILLNLISFSTKAVQQSDGGPSYLIAASAIVTFLMPVLFGGGNGAPTSIGAAGLGLAYLMAIRGSMLNEIAAARSARVRQYG
jgi:O-antigen ligase